MKRKYALFDWDNTVRKWYTLFSWVDYLCTHSIIPSCLQHELNLVSEQYSANSITHDQYVEAACLKYATALKRIDIGTINNAALNYIFLDSLYLFDGVQSLFDLLFTKGIDIIVISGAPSIILEKYKKDLHIKNIYAFKEQIQNEIFTGNVEYNYGFNKE